MITSPLNRSTHLSKRGQRIEHTKLLIVCSMNFPRWSLLFGVNASLAAANVRENGGNCVGVKSCRPRCITFRLERDVLSCGMSEGIFTVQEDINPWDTKSFSTKNCETTNTCENNLCGLDFFGDLTVKVGEEGHHGSHFYSTFELPEGGDDRFTFCSVYPCTKEECALPEQMVSSIECTVV